MNLSLSMLQNTHSIVILAILALCSIVCLAFIVERWKYFSGIRANPEQSLLKVRESLLAGRIEESLKILGDVGGDPIMAVLHSGVKNSEMPKEQVAEMMRATSMRQRGRMERNLVVLGTLGNTAPFIGLLGTVLGIIQAFRDLAGPQAAANGASVVAVGIAEALVATAAGLMVAIPAVVCYNFFLKKVKQVLMDMEVASMELLVLISLKDAEPRRKASHAG